MADDISSLDEAKANVRRILREELPDITDTQIDRVASRVSDVVCEWGNFCTSVGIESLRR